MNLLVWLAILIGLSLLLATPLVFLFKLNFKLERDLITGLGALILVTSVMAWFLVVPNVAMWVIVALALIGLASYITLAIYRKPTKLAVLNGIGVPVSTIFAVAIAAELSGLKFHRFYVNPDPYGYLSLKGALEKYGNIPEILKAWSIYSGRDFDFMMNWDEGSSKLTSLWLVPDYLLRYSIDVLNIPRVGVSSLLATITPKGEISGVFQLWLALGIIAVTSIILMLARLASLSLELAQLRTNSSLHKQSREKVDSTGVFLIALGLFAFLVINSAWVQVFLYEGFLIQLLSVSITLASLIVVMEKCEYFFNSSQVKLGLASFVTLSVTSSLVIYFLYVQQVIFHLLLIGFISIFLLLMSGHKLFGTKIISFATITLLLSLLSIFLPGNRYLLNQVQSSSGHGSIHIGSASILEHVGVHSAALLDRFSENGIGVARYFDNTMQSKASIPAQTYGYIPFDYSLNFLIVTLLVVFFVYLLMIFILKKSKSCSATTALVLSVLPFLTLTVCLWYLYSEVFKPFQEFLLDGKVTSSIFADYIWLRLLSNHALFLWIGLTLILGVGAMHLHKGRILSTLKFVAIVFSVTALGTFYLQSEKFESVSYIPSPFTSCLSNSNGTEHFVWETSRTSLSALALSLCGQNYFALNDPFQSEVDTRFNGAEVFGITSPLKDEWGSIEPLGKLVVATSTQAACDLDCLIQGQGPLRLKRT